MPKSLREQINKTSAFASPEEEAMLNIARTAAMLDGAERAFFRRFDLSPAAYNLMRILRGHHQRGEVRGVRASEIGCQMVVRMPDVTRLVDRLEQRGLVARESDENDRRVKLERIDPEIVTLGSEVLGHLSEKELATISRLMEKARDEQQDQG